MLAPQAGDPPGLGKPEGLLLGVQPHLEKGSQKI